MKKYSLLILFILIGLLAGCSSKKTFHPSPMPDPKSFNAHFGDMDTSGDDLVDWDEFKSYFDHAEPKVFEAIDLNKDGNLDHDEWHKFKEAHGLKEHD